MLTTRPPKPLGWTKWRERERERERERKRVRGEERTLSVSHYTADGNLIPAKLFL